MMQSVKISFSEHIDSGRSQNSAFQSFKWQCLCLYPGYEWQQPLSHSGVRESLYY